MVIFSLYTIPKTSVQGVAVVKLFCWEYKMEEQISEVRAKEVSQLKKFAYALAGFMFLLYVLLSLVSAPSLDLTYGSRMPGCHYHSSSLWPPSVFMPSWAMSSRPARSSLLSPSSAAFLG